MNSIIPFTEHNQERKFGKGGAFGLLIIGSKFSIIKKYKNFSNFEASKAKTINLRET